MKARIMGDNIPVYKDADDKGNWVTRLGWDSEVKVVNTFEKEGREWLQVMLPDGLEGYLPGDVPMSTEVSLDQIKADFYEKPGVPFDPPRRMQQGDRFYLHTDTVEHGGSEWLRIVDRRVTKGYLSGDTKLDTGDVESEEVRPFDRFKARLLKGKLGGVILMAIAAVMFMLGPISGDAIYILIALVFLALGVAAIYRSVMKGDSGGEGAKK